MIMNSLLRFTFNSFLLLIILICGSNTLYGNHWKSPALMSLKCPNGHTDFKNVTLIYGLLSFSKEIIEKSHKNEVRIMGCCVPHNADKELIICKICEYEYSANKIMWEKSSSDPTSFHPALPKILSKINPPENTRNTYYRNYSVKGICLQMVRIHLKTGWGKLHPDALIFKQLQNIGVEFHAYSGEKIEQAPSVKDVLRLVGKLDDKKFEYEVHQCGDQGSISIVISNFKNFVPRKSKNEQ